jgi:InsA C-terminal domain/InsA N-terminal domain
MIRQGLHCPHCHGTDRVRHGQTRQGQQRYRCRKHPCAGRTLLLDESYPGPSPTVQEQIVDMAMNASGRRDTARVLHISTNPGRKDRKHRPLSSPRYSPGSCRSLRPEQGAVAVCRAEERERRRGRTSALAEMWSYVAQQAQPRWVWHAIAHETGPGLA